MIDQPPKKEADSNTPRVSIIVPVYKVEKYLEKCLDSIAAQTYTNIEVILVDDGSPDTCGSICDQYAERNPIFKVIHQDNQGQAGARNNAVRVATGEFITFIDSDDYVEKDYIEYLVDLQKKYNADVSIGGFLYLYEGKKADIRSDNEEVSLMTPEEALIRMNYTQGFGATACMKLMRKSLVIRHPFPAGKIYEDLATMYLIIGDANRVVFGNKKKYIWLQREGSTTRMSFDERQMAGIEAAADQLVYMEKHYPNAVPAAKARYMAKVVEIMSLALHSKNSKDMYGRLKNELIYYKAVTNDPNVKRSLKIRMKSIEIGYVVAYLVFGVHEYLKKRFV